MLLYINKPLDGAVCTETCIPSEGVWFISSKAFLCWLLMDSFFFFHFYIVDFNIPDVLDL